MFAVIQVKDASSRVYTYIAPAEWTIDQTIINIRRTLPGATDDLKMIPAEMLGGDF